MSEETIQDQTTVHVLGCEFTKRPFTNDEADEWARIFDKRDLQGNAHKAMQLQAKINSIKSKRIELQVKAVETLEEKLQREYERDDWDFDKIEKLTDRILAENDKLAALQREDAQWVADDITALADELDETAQVADEAHLEMCHYLAGDDRTLDEWLTEATSDDYKAATAVVKAGNTPFLNRRQRRARKAGKGTH